MRTNSAIARALAAKPRNGGQVAAKPRTGQQVAALPFRMTDVIGEVAGKPFGVFHYLKERKHGDGTSCRVNLFPLKVTRQRRTWPEKTSRETKWLPYAEAAALVAEPELKRLILKFGAQQTAS